ncbi:uncharacterized protein LOC144737692 isoform X2 [Lampetra planeri]
MNGDGSGEAWQRKPTVVFPWRAGESDLKTRGNILLRSHHRVCRPAGESGAKTHGNIILRSLHGVRRPTGSPLARRTRRWWDASFTCPFTSPP